MKILIQSIILLITVFITILQVNSVYDYIKISNWNEYFLEYNNLPAKYLEDIRNWDITFWLENNSEKIEIFCWELWCFFVNNSWEEITDDGTLVINNNRTNKSSHLPYEITLEKKQLSFSNSLNTWFDISDQMTTKTIQKRALSCEISATADILTHLIKEEITEDILLTTLDKSKYNTLPYTEYNKVYWWNPQEWFVWYIDKTPSWETARQRKMTGYWVLEKPIDKIFKTYWIDTKIITQNNYLPDFSKQEHLTLILEELHKWNMVQLWWDICTDPKYYNWEENPCYYKWKPSWNDDRKISWNYKDEDWNDKKYSWLNWEHAFYLLWYKWSLNNPTHIIIWDTYTGKHTYVTSEWMRKWKKMEYKSIIVYAK